MPIISDWRILEGAIRRARGLPLGSRVGSNPRMRRLFGECVGEIEAEGLVDPLVAYETVAREDIGGVPIPFAGGARVDGIRGRAVDLATARAVVVAVATVGAGIEARAGCLFANRDVLRALLLEELGTAALFELSDRLPARIEGAVCTGKERLSDSYQPGEGVLPLSQQQLLCKLAGAERAGVCISGAGMMAPVKSMSLLFVVGTDMPRRTCVDRCTACSARQRCRYRQTVGQELAA